MTERIFYTYGYRHPRTKVWRYVGKGKDERDQRHLEYAQSSTDANEWHNPRLIHWIRKLKREEGLEPEIVRIRENLLERKAYDYERKLVLLIGRVEDGGTLLNHTKGGSKGTSGYHWSKEQCQAQSEVLNNYWETPEGIADRARRSEREQAFYQTPEGDARREQIRESVSGPSNGNFGKSRPEDVREAIGNGNRGKVHPEELREQTRQGVLRTNELKRQGCNCSTCLNWHNGSISCQNTESFHCCSNFKHDPTKTLVPQDPTPEETRKTLSEAANKRWRELRGDNSCTTCQHQQHPECKDYESNWCKHWEAKEQVA